MADALQMNLMSSWTYPDDAKAALKVYRKQYPKDAFVIDEIVEVRNRLIV